MASAAKHYSVNNVVDIYTRLYCMVMLACYHKVEDKVEKMCGRVYYGGWVMLKMMRLAMTKTKNWNYKEHPFLMGLQKLRHKFRN